jgi:tetratricopeptide (TPR) repeat protein
MNKIYIISILVLSFGLGCGAHHGQNLLPASGDPEPKGAAVPESEMFIVNKRADEDRFYYYLAAQRHFEEGDLDRAILEIQKVIDSDSDTHYLRRELAMYYLQQQNSAAALKEIEQIIAATPDDAETLFLYARTLEIVGRRAEATDIYEKLIEDDPEKEMVFLRLGDLYLEENDLDNAMRVYSMLVEHFPQSYAGHFFLGKIYSVREDYKQAEKHIRQTLDLLPGLEEPQYELADVYKKKGETKKAIEIYRNIVDENPDNIFAALELAVLYQKSGSPDMAEALLGNVASRSYNDPSLFRIIGQEYLDRNRFQEAISLLEGMLANAPEKSGVSYLLGIALSGTGKSVEAVERLKHVDESSRFFLRAGIQIAMLHHELGELDAAIEHIRHVKGKHPENQDLYMLLAMFYEEKEAYENAAKTLKDGLELNPEHIQMIFRLGIVYDQMGERKKSIKQLKKVLSLEPAHVNALNYLGYTYADMNIRLDEAEKLIRTALEHKPDDGYITDSLGWVYFRRGDYPQAAAYLERAVQLVPDDPIIREHLGDAYLEMKETGKAIESYRHSLSLDPENSEIEGKIKSLMEKKSPL